MWHIAKFQPEEIIDLAVQIEKNGAEMYTKLGQRSENVKIRELLLYLAAEEGKHQETFLKLGVGFQPVNPGEQYAGEYFEYLQSMVESHLFNDQAYLEKLIASANSELDIIRIASSFEKDTILFFDSFRRMVNKENASIIDELVKEEQGHLMKLAKIRQELS
ncbi:MAG: ferritin family protein [Carboxydocellales bacterium]